jgi:hypothetical protein
MSAERAERSVVEAGDDADLVAGDGEHQEPCPVTDCINRRTQVAAERRLTIRSRRHEVVSAVRANDCRVEAFNAIASVVLERNGRHRDTDILGEQGDPCGDIACWYAQTNFSTSACSAGESGAGVESVGGS